MLVRMRTTFTGFRNGEPWPPVGGTLDVPDHEAADLIRNRYADAVEGPDDADTNTDPLEDVSDATTEPGGTTSETGSGPLEEVDTQLVEPGASSAAEGLNEMKATARKRR